MAADNSAASPSDFTAKSLTGAVHQRRQLLVHVRRVGQRRRTTELRKESFVNVTSVSGANVADGQGTGTILNDDSCGLTHTVYLLDPGVGTPWRRQTAPRPSGGCHRRRLRRSNECRAAGVLSLRTFSATATRLLFSDGLFVFRGNTHSGLDVGHGTPGNRQRQRIQPPSRISRPPHLGGLSTGARCAARKSDAQSPPGVCG